jgi:Predicted hydrolases or acyltransferases (alpha/beta hydrolase superfamily)
MKKIATDFGIYLEEGGVTAAPAIVFLHAFPLSHAMWEPQFKALSSGYRIVSYDMRGLGESELDDGQFTMESFVDDLILVLDFLKIPRALLCGLSLGGYVALRAVEKFPERVSGLLLCNTRSEADDNAGKLKRAQSIDLLKSQGIAAFADGFVPALLGQSTRQKNPDLQNKVLGWINEQSSGGIVAALLAMVSRTDTTESLAKISVPTLVIHGNEDSIIPLAQAKAMQGRIPGSRFAEISGAGHLSNLEQPQAFNLALLDFLQSRLRL